MQRFLVLGRCHAQTKAWQNLNETLSRIDQDSAKVMSLVDKIELQQLRDLAVSVDER